MACTLTAHPSAFDRPPTFRNAQGLTRTVGVEVEFMGLSARAAAQALQLGLGGTVTEEDPHAFRVQGTRLGDIAVELDLRHVHPHRHGRTLSIRLDARSAAFAGSLLGGVVPRELITGPITMDRLNDVDEAVAVLAQAGARGLGATLFGSLGMHFNIDPPRLDAATVTAIVKAFALLEPWLRRETARGSVRLARVLAAPYPDDFVRRLADTAYWPDLPDLADAYLAANPTRNRALDLLPLLLHVDKARVRARLPREKIGSRPVFHYRLPLAFVSEPGWSMASDWNRWVAVERLAADHDRLSGLCRSYLRFDDTREAWARFVEAAVARQR